MPERYAVGSGVRLPSQAERRFAPAFPEAAPGPHGVSPAHLQPNYPMSSPVLSHPVADTARAVSIDALRSILTLLVVAHHAVLGYFLYAPPLGAFDRNLIWGAFPVIDAARAPGVDALVLWNDSFFMALLFWVSGLFVGPSLARKGPGQFLGDRLMRLGLPFVVSAGVLAPLAYFPAYLQRAAATEAAGFVDAWLNLGRWVAGPAWFLWVLLAFSMLTAILASAAPQTFCALTRLGAWCRERPSRLVLVWTGAALAAYVPAVLFVHPMAWAGWGPFFVQTSRVGLYAVYFLFGVALGLGGGLTRDLVAPDGPMARRWALWQAVAGLVFVGFVAVVIAVAIKGSQGVFSPAWNLAAAALMAVSGVLTSVGLLAYVARRRSVESPVWASLRRNAYGIYLVHYAIVTWLQYGFLHVSLPGLAKAFIVTVAAIVLSWVLAAGLRRLPGLRAIL